MTDQRSVDGLIDQLRTHVAELRRMEREAAKADEIEERKRLILRLQLHLAHSVMDVLDVPCLPQPH
jgi:hypothetical protein